MTKEIKLGDPIILQDASGMQKHGLFKGKKGVANQLVNVADQDLIMFMPNGVEKMYYMDASRFVLDVEALQERENG